MLYIVLWALFFLDDFCILIYMFECLTFLQRKRLQENRPLPQQTSQRPLLRTIQMETTSALIDFVIAVETRLLATVLTDLTTHLYHPQIKSFVIFLIK